MYKLSYSSYAKTTDAQRMWAMPSQKEAAERKNIRIPYIECYCRSPFILR